MTKEYVVLFGGVVKAGVRKGENETVDLTEAEALDMDPTGKQLQPKAVWDAHEKGRLATEAALKAIAEKAEAEKAKYFADEKAKAEKAKADAEKAKK